MDKGIPSVTAFFCKEKKSPQEPFKHSFKSEHTVFSLLFPCLVCSSICGVFPGAAQLLCGAHWWAASADESRGLALLISVLQVLCVLWALTMSTWSEGLAELPFVSVNQVVSLSLPKSARTPVSGSCRRFQTTDICVGCFLVQLGSLWKHMGSSTKNFPMTSSMPCQCQMLC